VIFGLILFLNVLPASLIIYPLTVRLAAREGIVDSSLVKAGLALTALLAAPQILILLAASLLVAHTGLGACAGFCLVAWQLQETTRRSLMARLAFGTALCTDAISYLGQAAVVWLCAREGHLSPEIAFPVGLTRVADSSPLVLTGFLPGAEQPRARPHVLGHWSLGFGFEHPGELQHPSRPLGHLSFPWSRRRGRLSSRR
jgi:hypothetical protein